MNFPIDKEGYPMMSEQEVRIIEDILSKGYPRYCLEWGSGTSTSYFPSIPNVIHWLSIEHNGHYIKYLKNKVNCNVSMIWVEEEYRYINCVTQDIDKYEFILIDGNWREQCLEVALKQADIDAVILLHDSGTKEYSHLLKKYKQHKVLTKGEKQQRDGFYAHRGLTQFYVKN